MIQVNSNSICLTGWVAWFGGGGTLLINASYIDSNGRSSSTWSNEETDLKNSNDEKKKMYIPWEAPLKFLSFKLKKKTNKLI